MLRKRWWLFGLIAVISSALSYYIATEFRAVSASISGSLIYTGLPAPPGPEVYRPPSLETYKQVLFTTENVQKIATRHGLSLPPDRLARLFEVKVIGRSSVMQIDLNWPDPETGVAIVNDTMQVLIEEAAAGRQSILSQHIKHVEAIALSANAEVANAAEELRAARIAHDGELRSNGLATERYSDMLQRISGTQSSIDLKEVEISGVESQLARAEAQRSKQLSLYQTELVKQRQLQLDLIMKEYNQASARFAELTKLKTELGQVDTTGKHDSVLEWETAFGSIGLTTLGPLGQVLGDELSALKSNITQTDKRISDLKFQLTSLQDHREMLKGRLAKYNDDATQEAGGMALASSMAVVDRERALEAAEARSKLFEQQLANMKQLEQCRSREFALLVPASLETAVISSNTKKLFVMSFFACSILLVCPVAVTEWLLQRESPVSTFARRWSLPLMTDRVCAHFARRKHRTIEGTDGESIRMAALRIQQSLLQSSNVVLFSGLGDAPTPAGVLSSISECLANRGERVLLVDAVDRHGGKYASSQAVSELSAPSAAAMHTKTATEGTTDAELPDKRTKGLSDVFCNGEPVVSELIQHTEHPCVDLISSGDGSFPVEAMASERLTELLMDCQSSYSMIFVAGPPISSRADFQMLAARADAIVLTADGRSVKHPSSHAAVRDLIELQAPIIGMMA